MNWALLQNSLLLAACVACAGSVMGLAAAVAHCGLAERWRAGLKFLAILSLAWPPFMVANAWLELLGPGTWLRQVAGLNPLSLPAAVMVLSLLMWPVTFLFMASAWSRVQAALLEADMAVRGRHLFRAVLWPEGKSSLVSGWLLTFVLALNNFAVPAVLQVKVLPAEVWIAFSTLYQPGTALLMGLPLILAPAIIVLAWKPKAVPNAWDRGRLMNAELARRQLGPGLVVPSIALTALVCGLSTLVPSAALLLDPKTWAQLPGAIAAGQSAAWSSFWKPAATATLLCILALLFNARHAGHGDQPQNLFCRVARLASWLPLFAPGVMLGIVLIWLFNRQGFDWLYQSTLIIVLALSIRYAALAWTPIRLWLCRADSDVVSAAKLAGASSLRIVRSILLPRLLPQLAAVWYVIFVLILWDVETVLLIYPPGNETLAFNVFNLLHYGYAGEVNAICLLLGCLALLPLLAWHAARWLANGGRRIGPVICAGLAVLALTGCGPEGGSNPTSLSSSYFSAAHAFGTRGAGVAQFSKPRSVAVDMHDSAYVVDMTGRVQKFSSNGVFELAWQMPQTDLGKPKGMTRGADGEIVIIEPHYQRLTHFDTKGGIIAQWGHRGTNAGQFILPRGVAVNAHGEIYVSEYTVADRVQWFSKHGKTLLGSFGRAGTGPGEFNRPEGVCVDALGLVYVADSCNHRIQIFTREGKFLRAYGKAGTAPGELSYPYDICVDAYGFQYVCEFGNSRIQIFDKDCKPIESIGGPGLEPGRFSNPWGIALDSAGNLWVADSQNHRIQKLIRRSAAVRSHS